MHDLVERWYSSAAYPLIQHVITPISNLIPVAFLDVLIVASLAAVTVVWWRPLRTARGQRARAAGRAAALTLIGLVAIYVAFQSLWGLNYQRVRLPDKLVLNRAAPSAAAVVELGQDAVSRL